jgi:hypothetical protein
MTAPVSPTDDELRAWYQEAVRMRAPAAAGAERRVCPEPSALLAVVERSGNEAARLATLDHVASCAACLRELELLRAIHVAESQSARAHVFSRPVVRGWAALAATVVVMVGGGVVVARVMHDRGNATAVRGGPSDVGVRLIPPVVSSAGMPAALAWHPVPGAVRYAVEVLGDGGAVAFRTESPDTTVTLPALPPGRTYRWWVRATLADGSERRSPLTELAPPLAPH